MQCVFPKLNLSGRDEGMEIEDVNGNTILLILKQLPEVLAVAFYTPGDSLQCNFGLRFQMSEGSKSVFQTILTLPLLNDATVFLDLAKNHPKMIDDITKPIASATPALSQ